MENLIFRVHNVVLDTLLLDFCPFRWLVIFFAKKLKTPIF